MCFPGGAGGKAPTCQLRKCKRLSSIPGWRRSPGGGQPTPVFLAGESRTESRETGGIQRSGHDCSDLACMHCFTLYTLQATYNISTRVWLTATPWTVTHRSHGSSAYGIFQARILEWVAISSSRGSSQPRDQTRFSCISCTGRRVQASLKKWRIWTQLVRFKSQLWHRELPARWIWTS